MIQPSFRRSLFHFSTSNLTRPAAPAVTSSKQPNFLAQGSHRLFSELCQDSGDHMGKKKNKSKTKEIGRKGPKRAGFGGGSLSQANQEKAMGHRGDSYRPDQARERLESAVWGQTSYQPQQQQYSQQQHPYQQQSQPQVYQPPNWPPQQHSHGAQREYPPGVDPRSSNSENGHFIPQHPWDTAPWLPPHQLPGPQNVGFRHLAPVTSLGGHSHPATSSASGHNDLFYFDLGRSQPQRGYSTVSSPSAGNQQSNSTLTTPQQPASLAPKMGKGKRGKHLRKNENRDDISAPSAASGGVPVATPEYLLRASFLPQTAPEPRPMLVVIDLNGTLLYRPSRLKATTFVPRPEAKKFLSYCIDTFHVVIWSSARAKNVTDMCDKLLTKEQRDKLVAIWGRDKFGLTPEDFNKRTQCYKRLTKLWEDPTVKAAHPHGEPWNQGNTVLIDDSAEKARSEPFNAITLPEFEGKKEDPAVLPVVHEYLNVLAVQTDISTFIRMHPFNLEADWGKLLSGGAPAQVEASPGDADQGEEIEALAPEAIAEAREDTQ
ncbi:HAD-like domain containing protein [Naviculisporaceae sp. PSN 640]